MNYSENVEVLVQFYAAQREIARRVALRPATVRAWLATVRKPHRSCEPVSDVSAGWRAARLNSRRHREIRALLDGAERGAEGAAALGEWLVRSLPASLLIDLAEFAPETEIAELAAGLLETREEIFGANYGLARAAAGGGRPEDYGDRLSAACSGLLDAIDRYVPGERSARFAFFATYWIRYQLTRHIQKCGSLISYPINQQRQDRRAGRLPSERRHPISIHAVAEDGPDGESALEGVLCDDAAPPYAAMDAREVTTRLQAWLRTSVPPATRVILAATHSLGPFAEASCDYLVHLRDIARERLGYFPGPAVD